MTALLPLADLNAAPLDEFARALEPLFESAPVLASALHACRPFSSYAALVDTAERLATSFGDTDRVNVVNAHPRIGAPTSAISTLEQGADDPAVAAELARLNAAYEAKFGFRFVAFVNKRPRSAILEVLRSRMDNPRAVELETALAEMFAIARDRLATLQHA